jgi:hypothetical protein
MNRFKLAILFLALSIPAVVSVGGCGGSNQSAGGCYVNGVYYPNGNAGNGQCTCPVIGPCSISFPAFARFRSPARSAFTVTVLSPHAALIAGGADAFGTVLNTALLEDPSTGTLQLASSPMTQGRSAQTATLLSGGKVLLAGGRNDAGLPLNTAELFDPATRTFTPIDSRMSWERAGHSAVLLPDGKVLLTGGIGIAGAPVDRAEIFDPQTQRFLDLPSPVLK